MILLAVLLIIAGLALIVIGLLGVDNEAWVGAFCTFCLGLLALIAAAGVIGATMDESPHHHCVKQYGTVWVPKGTVLKSDSKALVTDKAQCMHIEAPS